MEEQCRAVGCSSALAVTTVTITSNHMDPPPPMEDMFLVLPMCQEHIYEGTPWLIDGNLVWIMVN